MIFLIFENQIYRFYVINIYNIQETLAFLYLSHAPD